MDQEALEAAIVDYVDACVRGDAARMISYLDPGDLAALQRRAVEAAETMAALGATEPMLCSFGFDSVEELREFDPAEFMRRVIGKQVQGLGDLDFECRIDVQGISVDGDEATARCVTSAMFPDADGVDRESVSERDVRLSRRGSKWVFHLDTERMREHFDGVRAFAREFEERAAKDRPDLAPEDDEEFEKFAVWGFRRADDGKVVIAPRFQRVGEFRQGVAPVRVFHCWGYVNRTGALVIGARFRAAKSFSEDLAAVAIQDSSMDEQRWGYIDVAGEFVLEPRFLDAGPFVEGRAAATLDGLRWGYIDRTGRWVVEPSLREDELRYEDDPIDLDELLEGD
ncbi:MAG: WG repeat-containing protein [Planctomycetes bacterium]|nr:WG repeat-containing protein [Planctomycetota bacterium]